MMDPKHKEILITKRPELVENLNMTDGLFTHLMSKKVLNLRMVRKIQFNRTPEQQAEELLNILPTRGKQAFEDFCSSLVDDFQEEIVTTYLKPEGSDNDTEVSKVPPAVPTQQTERIPNPQQQEIRTIDERAELPPLRPSQSEKPCTSIVRQSPQQHDERDFVQSGRGVYQIIDDNPKQMYYKVNEHHEAPEFVHPSHDMRYISKHYVTNDPINRDLPDLLPWEKARPQNMPYPYPGCDKRETYYSYRSMEPSREVYAAQYNYLKRNDSIDAMTKRPVYCDNNDEEMRAKRMRFEDPIRLPIIEAEPRKPSLYEGDSSSYSRTGLPTPEPKIYLKDPSQDYIGTHAPALRELDDPDIDLTDGPVNVHVSLCSRKFYIDNYKKSYAMKRMPRGKALIINVNEVTGKPPRRGTNIDRDNLFNLLTQLHMDVIVYNDADGLSAKEIAGKLQAFAELPSHIEADCCVVCLLSHGEEGYVFGTDGKKLQLDNIFALFDNRSCKNLITKPKIFIIQACRGGALDSGVMPPADETDGGTSSIRQLPTQSDMLICYPTQAGYYAWRNRERGSWYIEALVQIFMKYSKNEDICAMLNRVNQLVSRKISHCPQIEMDQMSQMSEYKSSLRKPYLFFFPGIGSV